MNAATHTSDVLPPRGSRPRRRGRIGARCERGAALVEFALVLPLLMMLLLGIASFGFAFNYWIDATHLANQAARFAAVDRNPGPGATLQETVLGHGITAEFREGGSDRVPEGAQVCISYPNGEAVGEPVHVEVAVTYHWIPFLGDKLGVASSTISATADMRIEAVPDDVGPGCA
ncbi:MAG TPA: TadE/TadG family type IV pilus assembly protein [Solirubrobacteraceae bacterium]|nr:TadE/TadG family type IV pilus assembly protein [Solirubrobacteraceae bacterium]